MTLGYSRGEILLVAFIFALIYVAGLLPKIAARIAASGGPEPTPEKAPATPGASAQDRDDRGSGG